MSQAPIQCCVCDVRFELRFAYQAERSGGKDVYYCSQRCQQKQLLRASTQRCSVCSVSFPLIYAYQQVSVRGDRLHCCSTGCRDKALSDARSSRESSGEDASPRAHHIAVLNQKGGTAKTTTAVSLAAGLAEVGYRTLLIDMDSQGNVAVSLGVKGRGRSLYHVLAGLCSVQKAAINVRPRLDVILSNQALAQTEIQLAKMDRGRESVLAYRMRGVKNYDYVVLDCGPSLSLLNRNALTFADKVLIPVSCDFLSLVGVKQILKTMRTVNEVLEHPISILGVLPTFYDRRNRICNEAVATLKAYFKDRVLPPIRINTRLKEAPSHAKTIYEFAPQSRGAEDYRRLVRWLVAENTGMGKGAVEESRPDKGIGDEALHGEGPEMAPVGRAAQASAVQQRR